METEKIQSELSELKQRFEDHEHTGSDSPKIKPISLRGFPTYASAPTGDAEEGTVVFQNDGSATFKLYVRLNGAWKAVAVA
jgi:hypothetical protein